MDGQAKQWVHPAIYKEVMEMRAVGLAQAAGHDDAAEMVRAMEVAAVVRLLRIPLRRSTPTGARSTTHGPRENAKLRQVKRWGEGQ